MIFKVLFIKAFVNETGLSKALPLKTSSIILLKPTGTERDLRTGVNESTMASGIIRINSNSSQHSAL